ncbi:MAG: ATP-dependent zinc metalloprotease FtsH [Chloroflexota bacterium]
MQPNNRNNRPEQDDDNQQQSQGPNWNYRIIPIVLLVLLVMLIINQAGPFSNNEDINFSTLRENYTALDTITFSADSNTITGEFRVDSNVINEETGEPIIAFSSVATDFQQETLGNLIDTYNQCVVDLENPSSQSASTATTQSGDTTTDCATVLAGVNQAQRITIDVTQSPSLLLGILFNILPFLLIVAFFIWMMRRAQGQVNGVFNFGQSRAKEYDAQMPRVTFDDVAGQDAAKRELVEVVDFLKEPEKYISLGARIPRGVLLVGPPGTGKTLMARAVAGEANVAFYSIAASEFVEMFVGVGASRVRDLFNKAKDNSPSIVFIDEIDAVGRQRGAGLGGGNDEREQTLNQMLSELDGFDQSSTVIVMAATNRPDVLDPALLRPGRFDRQVTVDVPDREGRLEILKIHTRGKPLGRDIDLESIAGGTIGFSGADLANLANEAALNAARRNRKKIVQEDFSYAFERIILGTERPPLTNQEERQVVAYHEAGHALTALLTPGADQVLKVTITPRGQALGVTAFLPENDRRNYPRAYLEARIRVGLGGRAAEDIVFDEVTTGAGGDIQQVTNIARRMVTQFGMSSLGMVDYSNGGDQPFLGYSLGQGRQYSEETAARIDNEVRQIIDVAYEDTVNLLRDNREQLDEIAQDLLENEVIERERILEIMGMSPEKPLDEPEDAMPETDEDAVTRQDVADADDPFALFTDNTDDDNSDDSNTIVPPDAPDGDQPEQNQ